jgi:hypothetical protein
MSLEDAGLDQSKRSASNGGIRIEELGFVLSVDRNVLLCSSMRVAISRFASGC